MKHLRLAAACAAVVSAGLLVAPVVGPASALHAQAAGTTLIMETAKGSVTIQLFPADSPKSVEHILNLVQRNFYRGLRFHRVTDTLVQFGDPGTRNMARRAYWGNGNSGEPIGVAEISSHRHRRGAVALAHSGVAAAADSQLYIMKTASPSLDGKHAVIGQVTAGMDVIDQIVVADLIRQIRVQEAAP